MTVDQAGDIGAVEQPGLHHQTGARGGGGVLRGGVHSVVRASTYDAPLKSSTLAMDEAVPEKESKRMTAAQKWSC
jgi:hypothetical protein